MLPHSASSLFWVTGVEVSPVQQENKAVYLPELCPVDLAIQLRVLVNDRG